MHKIDAGYQNSNLTWETYFVHKNCIENSQKRFFGLPTTAKLIKTKKIYVPIVTYLSTKNTCTVTPKEKTEIFFEKNTNLCN